MIDENLDPAYLAEIERQATDWATECGRLAADQFRTGLTVEYKGPDGRDPVTEADRHIEDYLRASVSSRFPEHCVLGEERSDLGPAGADFVWVVDPIDGTVNFAAGLPVFAVSIGVLHRGVPVVGAVYVSQSIRLHPGVVHARRGGGCFLGEDRLSAFAEPTLRPSHPAALPAAFWRRFALGRGLRWRPVEVRTTGSIAYELALIAAGALQFGVYRSPRIWDVAGGVLMATEAGGAVLSWDRRRSSWLPLERFVAPRRGRRGQAGVLRDWGLPLLVGGSGVTAFVAQHLRPREGLHARLWPLIWRLLGG